MIAEGFFRNIFDSLDNAGVPYMLVGSVSAMMYGETRNTHDVDIVIDPTRLQLALLIGQLKQHSMVQEEAVIQALETRSSFSIIDPETCDKADFFFRKATPFASEEFSRRRKVDLPVRERVSIVSPEDCILSKLRWSKMGDSERQFRDAVGVASVTLSSLDKDYMEKWAGEIGVADLLGKLWPLAQKLSESRESP